MVDQEYLDRAAGDPPLGEKLKLTSETVEHHIRAVVHAVQVIATSADVAKFE